MNGASFLAGICMATFAASAVFFLKFWMVSRDRFFLLFALACTLISVERVVALKIPATQVSIRTEMTEASVWIYLIRLLAFTAICIAILDKNRPRKHG